MIEQLKNCLDSGEFLRIVCVGDAQTSQVLTRPTWVDWFQRALWENGDYQKTWRRQIINTATERATPRHVATYIRSYVGQYKPDAVIASFGAAPIFPYFDEKNVVSEFEVFVEALKRLELPVVFWSPYPLAGGIRRDATLYITELLEQHARANGWQYVDVFHEFEHYEIAKMFPHLFSAPYDLFDMKVGELDYVHIGAEGQYVIAKKLAAEICEFTLPLASAGNFVVPNMELLKRWNG